MSSSVVQSADIPVKNIMSDVRGIKEETTMDVVIELLGHHNCTGLCVTDKADKLAGVVSAYDCLKILNEPEHLTDPVSKHMGKPAISVETDTAIGRLASLFIWKRIHRVPVTLNGNLVGIVTRGDVMRHMRETMI